MDKRTLLGISAIVLCWLGGEASGRLVESWSYDRLLKESDLVVIAAPVTEEKADDKFGENPWQLEIVGVNTTFEVRHVLKGKADEKKVKVLHFRMEPPKPGSGIVIIEDGPGFVAFRTKAAIVKDGDKNVVLSTPEYLLYLRRLKDGRHEPVSGKVDPNFAVREVAVPLEEALGSRTKK